MLKTKCFRDAMASMNPRDVDAIEQGVQARVQAGAATVATVRAAEIGAVNDVLAEIKRERAEILRMVGEQYPGDGKTTGKAKVYKTRKAAEAAKSGNEQRLKKVAGGYILRDATEKEMVAADKAGRRLSGKRPVDMENDTLLMAIAKMGGLSMSERADTIGKGNKNAGGRMLFTNNGRPLDDIADDLRTLGYVPQEEIDRDGGTTWLRDAIRAEFDGLRTFHSESATGWMEEKLRSYYEQDMLDPFDEALADFTPDDLDDAGYTAAAPEVQAATEELLAAADAIGIDTEALREDAARMTIEQAEDAYHAEVQRLAREAIAAARQDTEGSDAGAAQAGAGNRSEAAGEEGDNEGLTLEAQTEEGLRIRGAARERADREDAAEQRRLANKARADAERDEFVLTGSDRPADVAAAAGQGGLFDAVTSDTEPAAPAQPAAASAAPPAQQAEPAGDMLGEFLASYDTPQEAGSARKALAATVTWKDGLKGPLSDHILGEYRKGARVTLTASGPAFVNSDMRGWSKRDIGEYGMQFANWLSSRDDAPAQQAAPSAPAAAEPPTLKQGADTANKRRSIPKASVLTPGGSIKAAATDSNAPSSLWYYSGDIKGLQFKASVVVNGQPDPRAAEAKATLRKIKAAQEAGWRLGNYRAGSLGTVWVFEKDGDFLSRAGMDNADSEVTAWPDIPSYGAGYDNMVRGQREFAAALDRWLNTLPAEQQANQAVVSRKMDEVLGGWAGIERDKLGLHVRYYPRHDDGKRVVGWLHTISGSQTWEEARAKIAEVAGAASPAANTPAPTEQPASAFDQFKATMRAVHDGTASVEDYKAAYRRVRDAEAVKAELNKLTKDELVRTFGIMAGTSEKKDSLVATAYKAMLRGFALGKQYGPTSYMMTRGGLENYERQQAEALDAIVENHTAEDLAAYAAEVKAERDEKLAKRAAVAESVQDPKTLDDFRSHERLKMSEGMTPEQARMSLTPEQRAKRDELLAEASRGRRKASTDDQRTQVRAAGQTVDGNIIATKHTRKGHDLYVVRLSERVSADDYRTLLEGAKKIGGYYSSYRIGGAIPGFQFTTREQAQAFVKLAGGDTTAAQEAAQDRRDAYADDRSQTAAERLTEMAEAMDAAADESLNRERKANTARRARFAAAAEAGAREAKAMAQTMRNVAQALTSGTAKFLDRIRTKAQVQLLQTYVANAKGDELRAKYQTYAEQEKRKGEPPTMETADYANFPEYTAYRSDLASLGRQLQDVDGTKKLGDRLMKVADDVSDAFTAWVKEPGNYFRVAAFSTKGTGERAAFPSKDAAERAIARSGYRGKAIPWSIKRGEWAVIFSPSEAIAKGLWTGDGDKRITLSHAFGAELVEGMGRANRRGAKVSVPWQFERAYERRKQLTSMGIETPAEFRAALREFIGLREQAAEADKIKEMERAMIGRRNDGLDFFPTPESVADEMVAAADIQPGMRVLEPSAGMGHIAERIRAAGVEPEVGEIGNDRRELLEAKGFNVVAQDFLTFDDANQESRGYTFGDVFRAPDGTLGVLRGSNGLGGDRVGLDPLDENGKPDPRRMQWHTFGDLEPVEKRGVGSGYDRILMNPPFSDGRDIQHVRHAYTLLKPGGRIVALMGESAFTNQNKRATEFREWLESVGGTEEKLPEGSFMDPSLPVNTGANARMVVIEKRADDAGNVAMFSRAPAPDTEAFRKWFGDSKVVDENGEPLVVYHGTKEDFVAFDNRALGMSTKHKSAKLGTFFSSSPDVAAIFAGEKFDGWPLKRDFVSGARTMPAYLSVENPLVMSANEFFESFVRGPKMGDTFRAEAIDAGYDGIRIIGDPSMAERIGGDEYAADAWVAFRPEQIKSAIGNRGTFDPQNPDIRFSRATATATKLNDVQQTVDTITATWASPPEVRVVWDLQDPAVDEEVRAEDARQRRNGATGVPKAFYFRGKVYVVASAAGTEADVAKSLFHEALGHAGLRAAFGGHLKPILSLLAKTNRAAVEKKGVGYGFAQVVDDQVVWGDPEAGLDPETAKLRAAEEVLAELAETRPTSTWVQKAIAAIRTWLRDNLPEIFGSMKMSDAEIIRNFIVPARDAIVRGREAQGRDAVPRFMRGDEGGGDDPMFSRSAADAIREVMPQAVQDRLTDAFTSQRGFNRWWHRTVGTQLHKAKIDKEFGRVYYAVQDFMKDVSRIATRAADQAPDLLPQIETLKDIAKAPPKKADMQAASAALFDGTLRYKRNEEGEAVLAEEDELGGLVWTDQELRARGVSKAGVKLYRQARAAINASLDSMLAADIYRMVSASDQRALAGNDMEADALLARIRKAAASDDPRAAVRMVSAALQDRIDMFDAQLDANDIGEQAETVKKLREKVAEALQTISDKVDRINSLKEAGYAPLMRFGQYTVDVLNDKSERVFFGMYETQMAANEAARKFREQGLIVSQGVQSKREFELLKGLSPETAKLFAELLGVEQNEAMQEWLKNAVAEQSALKRHIRRKGIEGFDDDSSRVVAAFLTSNARAASRALHSQRVQDAVASVTKGDVKDEAIALAEYVNNPKEEAQAIRSLLFVQYIGGSVASAAVNLTQTFVQTLPFLAQYGGAGKAGKRIAAAMRAALGKIDDNELNNAIRQAEKDGVIKPQEVFQLQAEASRSLGSNIYVRKGLAAWGAMFQLAEQYNRRVAFIAAYQTAKEEGIADPFAFAENAVDETQSVFNKGNRPNWSRGAVGATLFTFKTFTIQYLEFLSRLPMEQRLLALAVLVLLSGAKGLPFGEDAEDIVDTIAQQMGYNWTTKDNLNRWLVSQLGQGWADFIQHGVSGISGVPLDVSQRLGMADLLPGTGVLKPSETRKEDQVLEVFGVAGSSVRDLLKGEVRPVAIRNVAKALDMYDMGMYRDTRGRKITDTDAVDAALKGLGFQPSNVAREQRAVGREYEKAALYRKVKNDITERMALGRFENDPGKIAEAREARDRWNEQNPDAKITIDMPSVIRRVKEMRKSRTERFISSAPKDIRQQTAEALR